MFISIKRPLHEPIDTAGRNAAEYVRLRSRLELHVVGQ